MNDATTLLIALPEGSSDHDSLLLQILLSEVRGVLPELTTHVASSEANAVDLAMRDIPDVILLRASFEQDPGLDLLGRLRRAAPEIPIVVIAQGHDTEIVDWILESGAHDCLLEAEVSSASLGRSLRYVMERQRNETTLRRLAKYDPLTGLLTGQSLLEMLGRMLERRQKQPELAFGVLVVEVGDLYLTVRRHGRAFGDDLMVCIARRLEHAARAGDLVARLDGEDFVLLLQSISNQAELRSVADRVSNLLSEPLPLPQPVDLAVRSGLALSGPAYDGAHDMLGAAVLRLKCS